MLHSTDVAVAIGMLIAFGGSVLLLVRHLWRQVPAAPPQQAEAPAGPAARCQSDCPEIATEPSPRLERGRGSFLRDFFSMPPAYRRVVDGPAVYCKSHAHLADSVAAEFLAEERAKLSSAYAGMAHRAAKFEQEELPRRMRESLTDEQKKQARRPSSVVPIRKADEG